MVQKDTNFYFYCIIVATRLQMFGTKLFILLLTPESYTIRYVQTLSMLTSFGFDDAIKFELEQINFLRE